MQFYLFYHYWDNVALGNVTAFHAVNRGSNPLGVTQ